MIPIVACQNVANEFFQVVLVYSGHGCSNAAKPESTDCYAVLPNFGTDVADDDVTALNLTRLAKRLSANNVGVHVLIDACRSQEYLEPRLTLEDFATGFDNRSAESILRYASATAT